MLNIIFFVLLPKDYDEKTVFCFPLTANKNDKTENKTSEAKKPKTTRKKHKILKMTG